MQVSLECMDNFYERKIGKCSKIVSENALTIGELQDRAMEIEAGYAERNAASRELSCEGPPFEPAYVRFKAELPFRAALSV